MSRTVGQTLGHVGVTSPPPKTRCSREDKFPLKAYEVIDVCHHDHPEIACWTDEGKAFVVKNEVNFERLFLPKKFGHNNFQSFVRQLHWYGFQKVKVPGHPNHKKYRHHNFRRDRQGLLDKMKRKTRAGSNTESNDFQDENQICLCNRLDRIELEMKSLHHKMDAVIAFLSSCHGNEKSEQEAKPAGEGGCCVHSQPCRKRERKNIRSQTAKKNKQGSGCRLAIVDEASLKTDGPAEVCFQNSPSSTEYAAAAQAATSGEEVEAGSVHTSPVVPDFGDRFSRETMSFRTRERAPSEEEMRGMRHCSPESNETKPTENAGHISVNDYQKAAPKEGGSHMVAFSTRALSPTNVKTVPSDARDPFTRTAAASMTDTGVVETMEATQGSDYATECKRTQKTQTRKQLTTCPIPGLGNTIEKLFWPTFEKETCSNLGESSREKLLPKDQEKQLTANAWKSPAEPPGAVQIMQEEVEKSLEKFRCDDDALTEMLGMELGFSIPNSSSQVQLDGSSPDRKAGATDKDASVPPATLATPASLEEMGVIFPEEPGLAADAA